MIEDLSKMVHPSTDHDHELNLAAEVKTEKGLYEVCEGCRCKIVDRYIMRMSETSWHQDCLCCCVCAQQLTHSCYIRDRKLYCKIDYERLFAVKCGGCGERILPQALVMRAQGYVWHVQCFMCVQCCQPLQKGDQFVLRGGQLFCRADFEKELFMMQASPRDLLGGPEEGGRTRDGRRGPKRPRTILTSAQRRQFKASFEISPKPCRKVREALAKETGLSVRVVQVWFQNQRAKMKKIQRKQKEEEDKRGKDKDPEEKGGKERKKEDPESSSSSSMQGLLPMDAQLDNPYGTSTALGAVMHPYSPDGEHFSSHASHSGDSFCGSDISLDDSTQFDHLDDAEPHPGVPFHHPDVAPGFSHINPIDKLYLMQSSYFNSEQ